MLATARRTHVSLTCDVSFSAAALLDTIQVRVAHVAPDNLEGTRLTLETVMNVYPSIDTSKWSRT
jgi:hypothetical protein